MIHMDTRRVLASLLYSGIQSGFNRITNEKIASRAEMEEIMFREIHAAVDPVLVHDLDVLNLLQSLEPAEGETTTNEEVLQS